MFADYKAAYSALTLQHFLSVKALQPVVKDIQAKYQSNPEVMNQKIAEVYQTNSVNPLAGCLPSVAQIPIFIGLYRAVLELAKDNKLDEPFLWLPNLEGPVYGSDPTKGSAWLFDGWVNGAPSLGWDDTVAFLILPVFLVVSQFVSMEIMQPKTDSPQQGNFVLKLLPLMIGWFSLNVPAALCLYWVTNNIVTTATSVIIRNNMKTEPVAVGGATMDPPTKSEIFAPSPLREKPSGFSNAPAAARMDGVTPLTSVIDAEVLDYDDDDDDAGSGEQKKVRPRGVMTLLPSPYDLTPHSHRLCSLLLDAWKEEEAKKELSNESSNEWKQELNRTTISAGCSRE
jgi:YidC/Oxa1 family membrane protein insertase